MKKCPLKRLDGTEIARIVPSRDYFWSYHLKATGPRTKILNLFQVSYDPLSVAEICEKLNGVHPASIYRTMKALLKMRVIRRSSSSAAKKSRHALYELKPAPLRKKKPAAN